MPDISYNGNARVAQLSEALAQDPKLVAQVWNKQLREGARQIDDFSHFEGPEGSKQGKPFVVKSDLSGVGAGDRVNFSVKSQPRGPGVRGEGELTGNTSSVNFRTFQCVVDYWRDAYETTKKMRKFMATGGSLKAAVLEDLRMKLGRKRMNDMKMALRLQGTSNTVYPNGKKAYADLTGLDTMSPTLLTLVKPQWQRLGGMPFMIGKNQHGSPVYSAMAYIPDAGMTGIRNSGLYEQALIHAAERGGANPMFNGRLLDWQGIGLFEHISVDAEYDVYGDPLAPRAILGTGFSVSSAVGACKLIQDSTDTSTKFFEFFDGYIYEFYEGQASEDAWDDFYNHATTGIAGANRTYYAWIVNPDGSVGFVQYAGDDNNGNQITLSGILSPDGTGTSTLGLAQVGDIICTGDTWDATPAAGGVGATANTSPDFNYTHTFVAGAYIIPANAKGAVQMHSLFMGANTAVRCYAQEDQLITEKRDYGFVEGFGYETIFGQAPCIRTDGKTNGYALIKHAGQHPGLEVPSLEA
jgi:hypothetical protein